MATNREFNDDNQNRFSRNEESQSRFPRSTYANFQIVGRIGSTPEKQTTSKGVLKTQLVVSFNRTQKKEDGTYEKQTKWFYIDVFLGNLAQTCIDHIKKGDLVTVSGNLDKRSMSTDNGSQDKIALIATDIVLLHRKRDSETTTSSKDEDADIDSIPF
jgi:single stranded DNA-binding protein